MEKRVAVTLDLRGCKFISEVYEELRVKMEWADFFGENPDALWDILTGMPYKGDDFTIIRPLRYTNIPHGQDQAFTEYVDMICEIFAEAQQTYGEIAVSIQYSDM